MRTRGDAVLAVRFSHTGEHVVTCGRDRAFALWNARKGTLLKKYTGGHAREVRDCACARDGSRVATCGGDRGVFLWDVATGAACDGGKGTREREVNGGAVRAGRVAGAEGTTRACECGTLERVDFERCKR